MRLGRQLADHLGLEPGMLWVRLPPELPERIRLRGAAWSARLPVTQEIVGSNPIGDAELGMTNGQISMTNEYRGAFDFGHWHLVIGHSPQHGTQTGKAAKLKPSRL